LGKKEVAVEVGSSSVGLGISVEVGKASSVCCTELATVNSRSGMTAGLASGWAVEADAPGSKQALRVIARTVPTKTIFFIAQLLERARHGI